MMHSKDIGKDAQSPCTVDSTVQPAIGIGHNRPPKSQPFGLKSAWLHFAKAVELKRLAILHVRIERKKAALHELVTERQKIMHRCIRRMRRSNGRD